MPKYRITLDDGRQIVATAETESDASEAAESWAKSNAAPRKSAPLTGRAAADRDAARRVESAPDQVRAMNKGFSFGFADEVDAAGAALETGATNLFKRATGQKPTYGMKDAYGAVMDANQRADNLFAQKHPVQNVGLQIAGGAVGPGALEGARLISGARSLGGATVRSALVGGAMGAAAGAGNSRGLTDRAIGAAKGGATGAVVGAVLPSAGRVAQTAGRAVDNATGGRIGTLVGGHEGRAVSRLRQALQADGVDAATINRVTQEWTATGAPPPMLMNVAGENTRKLVRLAGMKEGDAANLLSGIGRRERQNLPGVARARARDLTPGEQRPANVVAEGAREARDEAANRAYAGPYREQTLVTPEMAGALRGQPGRAALRRARQAAEARQNYDQMAEIDGLLNGEFDDMTQPITAGTVDRIRIAMRNSGEAAGQNPLTRDVAGGLRSRAQQIDTALDRVPAIQPARGNYRAHSQFIEGVEDVGPNVFRETGDEFAPQFEGLGPNDVDARAAGARVGARQTVTDAFGGTPRQARGAIDKIADAQDPQRNLRSLFGSEADRFIESVRRMRQRVDDAAFVDPKEGSKTAPSQADAQAANDVVQVLQGNGLGVILQKLRGGLTLTREEAAIIAQIATSAPGAGLRRLNAPPPAPARISGNIFQRGAVSAPEFVAGEGQRRPMADAALERPQ